MEIEKLSNQYQTVRLTAGDVPEILALCQGNPQYYRHCPPAVSRENIRADMEALPPGVGPEKKYYLGFWDGETLAAVMDLILGYPDEGTAFIGFFMVDAARQGRGTGSALIEEVCACLSGEFSAIRLGYVRGNEQSGHFWHRNGFVPTGVTTRTELYEIVMMTKVLGKD